MEINNYNHSILLEKINEVLDIAKKCNSYEWLHFSIEQNIKNEDFLKNCKNSESGIIQVCEGSLDVGGNPYRFHSILRTDRGTFRFGTNVDNLDGVKLRLKDVDLQSNSLKNAIENLKLAAFWLKEDINSNVNK